MNTLLGWGGLITVGLSASALLNLLFERAEGSGRPPWRKLLLIVLSLLALAGGLLAARRGFQATPVNAASEARWNELLWGAAGVAAIFAAASIGMLLWQDWRTLAGDRSYGWIAFFLVLVPGMAVLGVYGVTRGLAALT